MSIEYELVFQKETLEAPAIEFLRTYEHITKSSLFGELFEISIEHMAHFRYENNILTYRPIKEFRFDKEDSLPNAIELISTEYANHEYLISAVWTINRVRDKRGIDIARCRFNLNFVGSDYDFQPEEKKSLYRVYCTADNIKYYNSHFHRRASIKNLSTLLEELDVICQAGYDMVIGIHIDRHITIESANLIYARDVENIIKKLLGNITLQYTSEELLTEAIDIADNIGFAQMQNGLAVYSLDGPYGSFKQLIKSLKMLNQ